MENNSNISWQNRLHPNQRLKSRKAIEEVFQQGKSVKAYPLRLVYLSTAMPEAEHVVAATVQIGFVAPKRSFRRAVDRNFVKRRMREAFRLHQEELYAHLSSTKTILKGMLIFTGRDLPTQAQVHHAWRKLIRKLVAQVGDAAS